MNIVLAAGGTAGHTLPALCFARELLKAGARVTLISDDRGLRNLPLPESLELKRLSLKFYQKRDLVWKALGLCELVFQALCMILTFLKHRPQVVVGFGGFPSFPALGAAWILGIPYAVHEQNALLGRVNRFFLAGARVIFTSFPHTQGAPKKSIHVGNPVRDSFLESSLESPLPQHHTLLIMGGSQGASIFSKVMPQALALLPLDTTSKLKIYQQARSEDKEALKASYRALKMDAVVESFFPNVAELARKSDLLVCRAGASTLAEIMALNKKALLIPYPFAMDNHQKINAQAFVEMGYGWMMLENEFTPETLAKWLQLWLSSPETLHQTYALTADLEKMKKEVQTLILETKN